MGMHSADGRDRPFDVLYILVWKQWGVPGTGSTKGERGWRWRDGERRAGTVRITPRGGRKVVVGLVAQFHQCPMCLDRPIGV